MKSDINDLCEAFLAALTNAGYAVKSIENYKSYVESAYLQDSEIFRYRNLLGIISIVLNSG